MFDLDSWMIWLILGLVIVLFLFFPRGGILAFWRNWRRVRVRRQVEDALKYIFNRQNENRPPSADALAGALHLSGKSVLKLLKQLQAQGLVQCLHNFLLLTPEGQRWALQVVRAHRLWERFLADEARMPLNSIHRAAHQREHAMTPAQIDALDAALGYPQSDPHGDPIPDAAGVLRGSFAEKSLPLSLTDWEPGERGRITHLEDEPEIIFAQLLAEGLQVGQTVTLLESTPERMTLTDGEREFIIAPVLAANVYLEPLEEPEQIREGVITLAELGSGEPAEILELDSRCQGFSRRRFLDLGLTPGTQITPELDNPFRDPRAYRVRGTLIALREDQAEMIRVRPQTDSLMEKNTQTHDSFGDVE